jgi:hypothetical protein
MHSFIEANEIFIFKFFIIIFLYDSYQHYYFLIYSCQNYELIIL